MGHNLECQTWNSDTSPSWPPHLYFPPRYELQNHPIWTYPSGILGWKKDWGKHGFREGGKHARWRRMKEEVRRGEERRGGSEEGRESGRHEGEGTSSRFGASQLKSEHRPQNPAHSIYLIFACERTAPLSGSNCTFNLSGLKERGNFSPCLSPHTLSRLNKPISWTFLLQRRLLYTCAK